MLLPDRKCQDESNCDFFHETEITNSFRNLAEPFTTFNSSDYHAISIIGKSGVRVSEICLGTMTFGKEWAGVLMKKDSREVFDAYLESGGNFIDTANRYTEGTSEQFLGKLINGSGKRDDLVIATKFSLVTRSGGWHQPKWESSEEYCAECEGSLKRLGLDYIDLYYLHAWDYTTRIEEVLRALDDLVRQGKILYTGISDTPAWIVSRGDAIAQLQGWTPFLHCRWSIPCCRDQQKEN